MNHDNLHWILDFGLRILDSGFDAGQSTSTSEADKFVSKLSRVLFK